MTEYEEMRDLFVRCDVPFTELENGSCLLMMPHTGWFEFNAEGKFIAWGTDFGDTHRGESE